MEANIAWMDSNINHSMDQKWFLKVTSHDLFIIGLVLVNVVMLVVLIVIYFRRSSTKIRYEPVNVVSESELDKL